jgi:hypothetical protein
MWPTASLAPTRMGNTPIFLLNNDLLDRPVKMPIQPIYAAAAARPSP